MLGVYVNVALSSRLFLFSHETICKFSISICELYEFIAQLFHLSWEIYLGGRAPARAKFHTFRHFRALTRKFKRHVTEIMNRFLEDRFLVD